MSKTKFVGEFELKASKKVLYPYLSTAAGLSQWFAEDVRVRNDEDKTYVFDWEGEQLCCHIVSQKMNQFIRFEFFNENDSPNDDPNYLEFAISENEFTNSTFIQVTDYSEMDFEEAKELWDFFIHDLKELVGG